MNLASQKMAYVVHYARKFLFIQNHKSLITAHKILDTLLNQSICGFGTSHAQPLAQQWEKGSCSKPR